MANTGQSLSSKTIRADGSQVFKCLQLRSRESLTENWQIISLKRRGLVSS
jgi:hypothetical protein